MATSPAEPWSVERLRKIKSALLLGVLILLVAALAALGPPALQRTVTEAVIDLVVVLGMFIFVGNSGVLSFGHIAFMAIAGYGSAILTIPPAKKAVLLKLPPALEALQLPVALAAAIAAFIAGVFALIVGAPIMRLKGIALPMATFGVLMVVHVVTANWQEVTGGRQALVGLPVYVNLWVAVGVALVTLAVAAAYKMSRRGLLLQCSRENEVAATASGIDPARERLVAFVLSAVFVGLGGILFAHFIGTVTANTFYLNLTFTTLAMLVVGGMRSLTGAVVGVAVVSTVSELFRSIEKGIAIGDTVLSAPPGLQEIALALMMLLILIFRPQGLVGDFELGWPRWGRGAARPAAPAATDQTAQRS
ncbi:branched-chain amino acid ABC transporter permease [Hypericibacter adhaerens]|jgi:branched-chain amino acid transport system permease protein|uniref:Branched-chain amino acid ABC transporter permease n=1 Tax=Hypericibacter adhaerens TaxID=2602016 RepID=A0A5J6N0B8_9PROT|nr:branched-chain amino acid ABC transporter permease [Hypericibacter adhaerens]QEX23448.1 branched-chain amino acid ABC transporter permease [Hypericibacter adhaerens]